jgi:hypothetical protein
MNEEMKRLIDVLNKAGYEVIEMGDADYSTTKNYSCSGVFKLLITNKSNDTTNRG